MSALYDNYSSQSSITLNYRITGAQAIERIDPLVLNFHNGYNWNHVEDCDTVEQIDFVWETTCESKWRKQHNEATICNRLHNSQVLEDKSNFAFLQQAMRFPTLESYIAGNINEIRQWAQRRWKNSSEDDGAHHTNPNISGLDWWVVKASRGNGGRDVWVINQSNFETILGDISSVGEFVLQRYVSKPLLWYGKKFHFRCYTLLQHDMSAYVYQQAFILTAGQEFDLLESADVSKHVTNLSVNKRIPGHPGQVPCDLAKEYPQVYSQIKSLWASVAIAVTPFMCVQRPHHFEFFGIDVISDENGACWCIEINRHPGLESSSLNTLQEDCLYNTMISSLMRIVSTPLPLPLSLPNKTATTTTLITTTTTTTTLTTDVDNNKKEDEQDVHGGGVVDVIQKEATECGLFGLWTLVTEKGSGSGSSSSSVSVSPSEIQSSPISQLPYTLLPKGECECGNSAGSGNSGGSGNTSVSDVKGKTKSQSDSEFQFWRNLMNWKAFVRKNRNKLLLKSVVNTTTIS
eukprot:gene692-1322_t